MGQNYHPPFGMLKYRLDTQYIYIYRIVYGTESMGAPRLNHKDFLRYSFFIPCLGVSVLED
jgi:hypothetical protein